MKVLLDTHVLLWAAMGSPKLSKQSAALINNASNELVFSAVSIWEIVIKCSMGRADFIVNPRLLRTRLLENGYSELSISSKHTLAVSHLPDLHRDPFDRLLIAQATVEGLTLLTSDPIVATYPGSIVKY